jgi:DNA processing protein
MTGSLTVTDLMDRAGAALHVAGSPGDESTRTRAARALWSALVEPGDGVAGALVRVYGPADAYERVLSGGDVVGAASATGLSPDTVREGLTRWRPRMAAGVLAEVLERAARAGARLLTPVDPEWPTMLDDLSDHAPVCLWVRGHATALDNPGGAIALVGARAATSYGEHVAGDLAAGIVAEGATVVSGAAYGIDGAAHRAALATGGPTVAFLAGGCDNLYPRGHAEMLERIMVHGAVVGEAPCGTVPSKHRFLLRNRLIAALAGATVVVEAGARSGSLNTAGHAAALGRPLGAVPGPVTSAASVGTHRMLREFDARCITSAAEALELIGRGTPETLDLGEWTDDGTRVRDALSRRVYRDAATVAARSGLAVSDVESLLGVMLLDGAVESDPSGWRLRSGGAR